MTVLGLQQCVCVDIKEGGDDSSTTPIFPIQPQWIDNLIFIGREIIGVEYLKDNDEDLTEVCFSNKSKPKSLL